MSPVKNLDVGQLPVDSDARKAALEDRAKPNPDKPQLPEDQEKALAPLDAVMAECYKDVEELTFQWHLLSKKLRGEEE
jgi:hypothetical protein